jgi:hypothetical protein
MEHSFKSLEIYRYIASTIWKHGKANPYSDYCTNQNVKRLDETLRPILEVLEKTEESNKFKSASVPFVGKNGIVDIKKIDKKIVSEYLKKKNEIMSETVSFEPYMYKLSRLPGSFGDRKLSDVDGDPSVIAMIGDATIDQMFKIFSAALDCIEDDL